MQSEIIQNDLDRYLFLDAQRQLIEDQLKELRASILAQFDPDVTSYGHAGMNFQRCERKTYTYSEAIAAREQQLKDDKKAEEKSGAAIAKVTTYLRVTPVKSVD
ncbi:hypothetical protein [Synechococcus elongatus]|uniref:hypothetical protein n=1 Tax=Synechococcus elongatus TaxID=32046 RepID=UPI000F7E73F1|nr:hypothetical protein [Synechococcus elongatus]